MSNDQIGSRSRQHKAYQNDNSISTIEHVQNIANCSTIGFAQSDLFAAILRFKQNQSECPQRRYQHGQQTEQRNLSGLATLLFVHIADRLIKKVNLQATLSFRIKCQHRFSNIIKGFQHIGALDFNIADI